MKLFKKAISLALVFALLALSCVSLASCGDDGKYTIGICQLVTHDALDAATQGFKDAVIEALGEENVTFIEQNAGNDIPLCNTIATDFVAKNVDLIMANATPALQAAASATADIPVLGTSVTEYGVALGIKDFDGLVGGNISGTSDLAPLNEQAQMILDLCPDAEKVGLLYCSAEANSKYQVEEITRILIDKGIKEENIKEYAFTDSNDVAAVTTVAAENSDVIYVPTDNTVAANTEIINSICLPKKVPIIAGESGICSGCGIATLSISYYDLGYATGEMAVKILKGEEKISKMPIQYVSAEKATKKYNKTNCDALGIAIPEGYTPLG
ncbi:MAG: ABC transporter substrate-binding protein [Ruminococcaceae bacterium]|nr:ABC transporter substrate-binding protein [Oscillospiraceae bacterium]